MKVQDPQLPSEEEVKCHELTHLPYRSWCSHCVRSKGRATDHQKQNRDLKIPELHVDYCFSGSATDSRPGGREEEGRSLDLLGAVPGGVVRKQGVIEWEKPSVEGQSGCSRTPLRRGSARRSTTHE